MPIKKEIRHWHGNFIPIRDKTKWSKVMMAINTGNTMERGLHEVSETVHL
jgi:hypothetical protein